MEDNKRFMVRLFTVSAVEPETVSYAYDDRPLQGIQLCVLSG